VFYRILTVIGGALFVAILFALVWLFCRLFLQRQGVTEQLQERATNLATWTFVGISVGLVFAIVGAFVLGPWAFYRTLRGHDLAIDSGKAIWWGFAIVVASLGITAAGFFGFLGLVGAY
jgi:ABC-type Co2+ transport system permease subunit